MLPERHAYKRVGVGLNLLSQEQTRCKNEQTRCKNKHSTRSTSIFRSSRRTSGLERPAVGILIEAFGYPLFRGAVILAMLIREEIPETTMPSEN